MNALLVGAASALDWLARTSWQVAALVVLVLLVQAMFRKWLTPRWRYALWGVVVLRLALPVLPPDPLGIGPIERSTMPSFERTAGPTMAEVRTFRSRPRADALPEAATSARTSGLDGAATEGVTPTGMEHADASVQASPVQDRAPRRPAPALGARVAPASGLPPELAALAGGPSEPAPPLWPAALAGGWALVAGFLLLRTARGARRFRRRIESAQEIDDPAILAQLQECARAMGLRRPLRLFETGVVRSPAATGVRRPRLLLPTGVRESLSPEDLRHVFLHEAAHLRRGDLALSWLLATLQCLHWFNPFVHLAFARLRGCQESVRDWDAMRADPSVSPDRYAGTFLKLLETCSRRGHAFPAVAILPHTLDAKRRMLMILDYSIRSRAGALLGATLLAGLGWAALTSAAAPAGEGEGDDPAAHAGQYRTVKVVHQSPPEPWRAALRERLQAPITADLSEVQLDDATAMFRELTGVNFILGRDAMDSGHFEEDLGIEVDGESVEQALSLACEVLGVDYCLTRGAVLIGTDWEMAHAYERRYYKVDPILTRHAREIGDEEELWVDDLMDLLYSATYDDSWDEGYATMSYWNGLLCITQTPDMHDDVEATLNLILNRGVRPEEEPEAWRRALQDALEQPVDVTFDDVTLGEAVEAIRASQGLPVYVSAELGEERGVDLTLYGEPLAHVLEWIAGMSETSYSMRDGMIWFKEQPPLRMGIYDIGDLRPTGEEWEDVDDWAEHVIELVQQGPALSTWEDYEGVFVRPYGNLLIARNCDFAHDEVESTLAALRLALNE